jgi:hypothetical protein
MKPRINLITLGVKDIEKSIHFYEHGLGLPRMPFEGNVAFFELSGSWLSLYPWSALAEDAEVSASGEGFRGVTLAYNVATKSEVDEVMAQAEKAGATIQKPPRMYSGEAIPVTFQTLMDIYGRWLGIRISGLGQRMNKSLTRQFKLDCPL